jgi:membrane-associated protease RseP (regulator of RpoE activity)
MQIRINIRKAKALIWLAGATAFVFAGWTCYGIFRQKQDQHYEPHSRGYFTSQVLLAGVHGQPQSPRKQFATLEECQSLWDCLMDGSVRAPDGPAEPPAGPALATQTLPPIDSIVQVGLIVWTMDPARRFAAITYKSGAGVPGGPSPIVGRLDSAAAAGATVPGKASMLHLSQGDPLEPPYCNPPFNGRIVRIDEQEVTCRWGDSEATITPSLGRDGTGQPNRMFDVPPEDDPSAALAVAPAESTKLQEGHWVIGSNDRERLSKDALQFLDQELNVRTITPAGGGYSSLEITEVKPGSLAAQVGAQAGDRIVSINGIPMNSLSGAVNWFDQTPGQSQYVVVYDRHGKQDSLTFHVK